MCIIIIIITMEIRICIHAYSPYFDICMINSYVCCKINDKLSERKVLRFTGFHEMRETFMSFASTVWKVQKKAIAKLNIRQENFCNLSKIRAKTAKLLSCLTFVIYSYITFMVV